ncbi:MAG: sortase [Candidatus Paceibacterota bacterium]|jgi:LPXTG-site transpeptidase (sortase) family protein
MFDQLKNIKPYLKFFVVFYLIMVFVLNWNSISWMVNFNFLTTAADGFLAGLDRDPAPVPADSVIVSAATSGRTGSISAVGPKIENVVQKEDSLIIEKIGVEAPLVRSPSDSAEDIGKSLKKGVMIYPTSDLPSESGVTVVLGHTAPDSWPKINYYGIFNRVNELQKGDEIKIYFQGREYIYAVNRQFLVNPGTDLVPSDDLTNSENVLFLSTCWPPNSGTSRIIIEASR